MNTKVKNLFSLLVASSIFVSLAATAAPLRLDFDWVGDGNASSATGFVIFEDTLLPNPGVLDVNLPNPAVLALSITISGAASGNGTFGLADFAGLVWDTQGAMLDLTSELIGQPTTDQPWGTIPGGVGNAPNGIQGVGGDFNLFSLGQAERSYDQPRIAEPTGSAPPNGVFWFTLGADGGFGDTMILASMGPSITYVVPTLNVFGLILMVLALIIVAVFSARRQARLSMKG